MGYQDKLFSVEARHMLNGIITIYRFDQHLKTHGSPNDMSVGDVKLAQWILICLVCNHNMEIPSMIL